MAKDVSLSAYLTSLFEDSLLTGIPQILQTRNVYRKILKTIVLLCCLIGFIYQTTEFMKIFWNYPTVLDIEVEYPEIIEKPAITFCNLNGIKRGPFCQKYPSNCSTPKDVNKFCKVYPNICELKSRNLRFPFEDALTSEQSGSDYQSKLKEMGHSYRRTLKHCNEMQDDPNVYNSCKDEPLHMLMDTVSDGYRNCYTLFSSLNSSKPDKYIFPVPKRKEPLLHMVFDPEADEYFRLDREVGISVAIHSPNSIVNPFYDGFIVKPGRIYSVHLKLIEEKLLPYPYETKCQDYKLAWKNNGRKGPLSQEICVEECLFNASLRQCNCVLPSLLLPHDQKVCDYSKVDVTSCFTINITECYNICQQSCEFTDFDYDVKERKLQSLMRMTIEDFYSETLEDPGLGYGIVLVFLKRPEKIIYSHRPQYEDIEVFSFMGGYVGMWLGVSLIAAFDFVESVTLFIYFWITKKTV